MNIHLIIIGDEILSGKRQDQHLGRTIALLAEHGLTLGHCEILPDDPLEIEACLRRHAQSNALVFCCGGIGATPDDYTRAAAARALNQNLIRHPEAARLIEQRFGADAYPQRIRMADLPEEAHIIPNPVNQVPGFSVGNLHFLPGFPEMASAMMAWVLEQSSVEHLSNRPEYEISLILPEAKETDWIAVMEELLQHFAGIKLSSLPSYGRGQLGPHIELGLAGSRNEVLQAQDWLEQRLQSRGQVFWPKKP